MRGRRRKEMQRRIAVGGLRVRLQLLCRLLGLQAQLGVAAARRPR
jgi:hypothetical protein